MFLGIDIIVNLSSCFVIGNALQPSCLLFPNELPVIGRLMPAEVSCDVPPHLCEVGSSTFLKCTRIFGPIGKWIEKESKSVRTVCLTGRVVCISSSSQKVIKFVVDLAKESFLLVGHDLTVGGWVINLPKNNLSNWDSATSEV